MITEQGAEKGRLTRAVRPDQTEHVSAHERSGGVVNENALVDLYRRSLRDGDTVAAASDGTETQRHRRVVGRRSAETSHSRQTSASPLRLAAVLPGDVARDVVLLARDLALLMFELSLR